MSRKAVVVTALVVGLLALVALMNGVGGDRSPVDPPPSSPRSPSTAGETPVPDAHAPARITATAVFRGTPPAPKKIKMTPECGPEPYLERGALVREDGALANVVVRVVEGVPAARSGGVGVEIVQERCQYRPRVAAIVSGQDVKVTSRDEFLHNVHAFDGAQTLFNKGQPSPSSFVREAADFPEAGPVAFKCDVHPWMLSWVFVHPNPHIGVTGESGTVTLLPPPGELTLEAWHETLGVKRLTVHAKEGEPLAVTFEFP